MKVLFKDIDHLLEGIGDTFPAGDGAFPEYFPVVVRGLVPGNPDQDLAAGNLDNFFVTVS